MSYASIYVFRDGTVIDPREFRNGHGGAPAIWESSLARHRPNLNSMIFGPEWGRALASLETDPEVPWYVKACLFMTYAVEGSGGEAGPVVMAEHLLKVAEAFELFTADHAQWWINQNRVYHLDKQAVVIRQLHAEGVEALGWQNTSACSSIFEELHTNEAGEDVPYHLDMKLHYTAPLSKIFAGEMLNEDDLT